MLQWAIKHIGWLAIRITVTLAGVWTMQNLIHKEGYLIDFRILLVGAICLIVMVRFWMPSEK